MKKRVIVLSLGGSLIVPNEIDLEYLKKFRNLINRHTKKFKFVIVCGGGSIARKYIDALTDDKKSEYLQSLSGIAVTRLNARFMAYFFGKDPEWGIPHDMNQVKNLLLKNDVIFCGALRYAPDQTSDTNAVRLAHLLKTDFVNLTNVRGLYDKNPKEKDAKFIARATIDDLYKIVMAIPSKPGMHGPVDHTGMRVIKKHNIKTIILGKDLRQFENYLGGRKFIGSIIE